jgi:hypothetical protein
MLPDPWIPFQATVMAGLMTAVATATGTLVATNNDAHFWPVTPPESAILYALRFWAANGTGNYDLGLYDSNLNLLVSSGSTAMTASGVKELALPELEVDAGELVYAAIALSLTTGQTLRNSYTIAGMTRAIGHGVVASGLPLPNPATPDSAAAYSLSPIFAFGVR